MSKKKDVKPAEVVQEELQTATEQGETLAEEEPQAEVTEAETPEKLQEGTTADQQSGYVEYCLPFLPGKKPGDFQTVTINGKNYQVKYGEKVMVPKGVRDVLEEMVQQSILIEKKVEELKKEKCITKIE